MSELSSSADRLIKISRYTIDCQLISYHHTRSQSDLDDTN